MPSSMMRFTRRKICRSGGLTNRIPDIIGSSGEWNMLIFSIIQDLRAGSSTSFHLARSCGRQENGRGGWRSSRRFFPMWKRWPLLAFMPVIFRPFTFWTESSMGSGPDAKEGYDLALTEVAEGKDHFFIIRPGSSLGEALLEALSLPAASHAESEWARSLVEKKKEEMVRQVDNSRVPEMLKKSWLYKSWDSVAQRCINCTNCTLACPTCFCSQAEERVSLDGAQADHVQSWESCFNLYHSYVHGGSVRFSPRARYRQWLTHKFGTWWDQFGLSGCVGCGRCITWCPVGIDVTEELNKLQMEADHASS